MKRILFILCICITVCLFGQKNYNMVGMELQLEPLMNEMFSAESDNERFLANDKFINELEDALMMENSFSYPFAKLDKISILTSSDKQFRILTWAICTEEGQWENFGFVQSRNNNTSEYDVYRLFDKGDDITDAEGQKLDDSTWFGAVYYDLIENKTDNKTYYVLLGWDGNDIYLQKKVIEPICFKGSSSRPQFGQNVFYKEKDRMRKVFEYSTQTVFTLEYAQQYYEITSNQKAKSTLLHKAKPFEKEPSKIEKQRMIFYDELEPQTYAMEGLTQYYVPSGNITGLYFENGKWKTLKHNVQPRNKAQKEDDYVPNDTKHHSLFPQRQDEINKR